MFVASITGCRHLSNKNQKDVEEKYCIYFDGFGVKITSNLDSTKNSVHLPCRFQKLDKDTSITLILNCNDSLLLTDDYVKIHVYYRKELFDYAELDLYQENAIRNDKDVSILLCKQLGTPKDTVIWWEEQYQHLESKWMTFDSVYIVYDKGRLYGKGVYEPLKVKFIKYSLNKSILRMRYGITN